MTLIDPNEEKVFKEILSGKYRDEYLIYNRKSTDEPNNQKNSIKYQTLENARFAIKTKLRIADLSLKGFCAEGIISEKHSGFKEDNNIQVTKDGLVQYKIARPKFQKLIQFLSRDLFKGVICLCWDRVSRNRGDDTIVRKLMRKGIDIRFAYAHYEKTSSGALHMDIDGMFAEHHSRVTSEKVSINIWNLREQGICTYRAPMGYLNLGSMEHKPLDPERAPIIAKLFEYYATGEWSLSDLARFANRQGLTTLPMRRRRTEDELLADDGDEEKERIAPVSRPVTINHIHHILTNPFYTGKILGNSGEYVPSKSHEALVSQELFGRIQNLLRKKSTSIHYTEKIELPLRGKIHCAECGRVYTPYLQKGIQYFSSRCRVGCTNTFRNCNIDFIEHGIGKHISKLNFNEEELIELDARTTTDISLFEERRLKKIEETDRVKKKIREDISYLRSSKLTLLKSGVYSPESLIAEETKLQAELTSLHSEEIVSDISMHEMIKDILRLSELLKSTYEYYSNSNSKEKEQIIRIIFSELLLSEKGLQFKCKNGFQALEDRFMLMGDPTTWLSEATTYHNLIKDSITDLSLLRPQLLRAA